MNVFFVISKEIEFLPRIATCRVVRVGVNDGLKFACLFLSFVFYTSKKNVYKRFVR